MKTLKYSVLISCIALVVSACGGGGSTSVDKPNSSSSSSGGVTAPAGKKTYRLDKVELFDVADDESITLKQIETFTYNNDNNVFEQRIRTYHGGNTVGRLALEIDFEYDSIDTWQSSVVTMNNYDSWMESGNGNLFMRAEWVDTWNSGKFVSNTEMLTFYNTSTGEQSGEAFHQAFRSYTGDYNTLFEIDYQSDNSIDRTEERTWTDDGQIEWVFTYSGSFEGIMGEVLFTYDDDGLLSMHESYDHITQVSTVRVYDFTDPTQVIMGKASGPDEFNLQMEAAILTYKQAPCGKAAEARLKFEIEPIPRCFVK